MEKEARPGAPSTEVDRCSRARILYEKNQFLEAESAVLDVLKADPLHANAYHLLADVECALRHMPKASLAIEQWLTIQPDNPAAWSRLGRVKQELAQSDEAANAFKRATELEPECQAHWVGLALSAIPAQKLVEAIRARDHLVQHFQTSGWSHVVDGHIHKILGNVRSAISAYERALESTSSRATAIYNLVDLRPPSVSDPFTLRINVLLQRNDISSGDKANLNFSLARICERAKQYDNAFVHFQDANRALQRDNKVHRVSYDNVRTEEQTNRTIRSFSDVSYRYRIESLPIDLNLIFIVGLPRSGTTLLEQILQQHPQVTRGGELSLAQICHHQYNRRRAELKLGGQFDCSENEQLELLLEARESYIDRLFELDLDGPYITDKMPGNIEILGFIRLLFPDAVIIHIHRHLLATCWSLYASNLDMREPYDNSFEDLAHYCRMYRRLVHHWRSILRPPIIDIRYEDIVTKTEDVVRQMLFDIGLPWNGACMEFFKNDSPVLTASHSQVRQPIYTSSVDRWRSYEPQIDELKRLLRAYPETHYFEEP